MPSEVPTSVTVRSRFENFSLNGNMLGITGELRPMPENNSTANPNMNPVRRIRNDIFRVLERPDDQVVVSKAVVAIKAKAGTMFSRIRCREAPSNNPATIMNTHLWCAVSHLQPI